MRFSFAPLAVSSLLYSCSVATFTDLPLVSRSILAGRQPGGSNYQCHANCGYTIQKAVGKDYCKDDEWLELFNGCMKCALKEDIWGDYGRGVTAAAEPCGLDATPDPVDGDDDDDDGDDSATTTAAETTAATSPSPEPTEGDGNESDATTAVETHTSVAPDQSEPAPSGPAPSPTTAEVAPSSSTQAPQVPGNETTSSQGGSAPTSTPPVVDAAGPRTWLSSVLAVGAAFVVFANLI